jgi:hypothetical protein
MPQGIAHPRRVVKESRSSMTQSESSPEIPALRRLESGEQVTIMADAGGAHLIVTDRRLAVAAGERIALDVRFRQLRRIQFDIERRRPATLVIVPERPTDEPQVLAVPRDRYEDVAKAIAIIGHRLHEVG